MTLTVLPFTAQLPAGYRFPTDAERTPAGTAASTPSATPVDTVSFGNSWQAGSFTAEIGDRYRMSDLFHGSAPSGQTIAGYRVALGGDGNGALLLDGDDVSSRTNFTADEFAHLTFAVGENGLPQDLVVVAQTGTRLANGTLTHVTDSPVVLITAKVGSARSIDALNALATPLAGSEADVANIVTEAGIYTGFVGTSRPTLQTAGNFTAAAGDVYRLGDLFHGSAPAGQAIAGYRIALGGDGNGTLTLNGTDVSSRTSFTADEFAHLTYTVGDNALAQKLVVVAQTGTRLTSGVLTHVTDSSAVQITADVTGARSINALPALATPAGADAAVASIASEAAIYTGSVGHSRPTLQTVGNFTVAVGDIYRLNDLYQGSAPAGESIAGYRIALGNMGNGTLWLDGDDVSDRTSFTADEFAHLTYVVGDNGSPQTLVVVAQTGTRLDSGALTRITDSAAVQITAEATGVRSINALKALATPLSGAEARIASIASEAGIYTGSIGASRPTLQTAGNFAAKVGDAYRLGDLFHGSAPTGQTIAGYRVALGGDGNGVLLLNGADVGSKTSFTADEFAHLIYAVGDNASPQTLVVVAQTGTRRADGVLTHITDSEAVQVVATPSADRSVNALNALATPLSGAEAAVASIASEANIFTGSVGASRPVLHTVGNFTAVAGDTYRLGDLFRGSAPAGGSIAGYRVALAGDGNGTLMLNGSSIDNRTSFTADEFARLTYTVGDNGLAQNIVAVAQTGTRLADGVLTHITDSPAVQITADIGSARSLQALPALVTSLSGAEAVIAGLASEASIYTGFGTGRPSLLTALTPEPSLALADLAGAIGNYQTTGGSQSAAIDLMRYYQTAAGSSDTPGNFSASTSALVALIMLDASAPGGFSVIGDLGTQSQAIRAYITTKGL